MFSGSQVIVTVWGWGQFCRCGVGSDELLSPCHSLSSLQYGDAVLLAWYADTTTLRVSGSGLS